VRVEGPLRAVYTRDFCVRFSIRDGATAQLLPLLFSRDHVREKAKEAVGQWHHRGRRNGRKKRECRRTFRVFTDILRIDKYALFWINRIVSYFLYEM
jgi:hypothetical protein